MIDSGTTIALYMPGADPRETVNKLAGAGVLPETPCAVVSRASTSAQQTTITTLEKLPSLGAQAKPSILILGDVVRLSKLGGIDLKSLSAELLPAHSSDQRPEANRA
jgi:siroheme synthase